MASSSKILLIESDKPSAPSFASALDKRGYGVSIVHSTTDAVAKANGSSPDVIVIDAVSLKTSGARMCSDIRKS